MTKQMNMAPVSVQLTEAGTVNTNPFQEEGVTMTTIVPEATVIGQTTTFDTTMRSTVNHGGAQITASVGYSEYFGAHDIIVNFVNRRGEVFYLDIHEARDLAAALMALANHIDEDEGTIITRRTEAGAPAFEEGI